MKILKTKKVNIAICYNGLTNMPPKEFPTITELEQTPAIIEKLESGIPEFIQSIKDGEKMNTDIITGKVKNEEIDKVRSEYYKVSTNLEMEHGKDEVVVEFENNEFNTFFQQFERWGKMWFMKLEAFLEFRKEMTSTNSQPKEKAN
jgi:uncharacterized Fe-S cluster-containing protein